LVEAFRVRTPTVPVECAQPVVTRSPDLCSAWLRSYQGAETLSSYLWDTTLVCVSWLAIIWPQSRTKVQSNNTLRLSLGLPKGVNLHRNWHPFEHIAVSPDGQTLAFAATDASGRSFL